MAELLGYALRANPTYGADSGNRTAYQRITKQVLFGWRKMRARLI